MIESIKCVCGIWFYPLRIRGKRHNHCSRECRFRWIQYQGIKKALEALNFMGEQ